MNELDFLLVAIQVDLKTIVFSLSSLGNCTVLDYTSSDSRLFGNLRWLLV